MEEHFLKDYVSGPSAFSSAPWYNPCGDCIVFESADEATVAERIDDVLTIYRSAIDDRPIGFQIKGVRAIIAKCGFDALTANWETRGDEVRSVSIAGLLLAAYENHPPTIRRRSAYSSALSTSAAASIPVSELATV
ncbi:MAG: hypothetical protein JXA69_00930 [Phycisphaerae bacterium]|nr:hypothetical protein [Phycisphaerae bacterium]